MSGKLYQEALLDLEEIKKVVEEDAKKKIYEELTPKIKSIIEKRILGEIDEEENLEEDENGNVLTDKHRNDHLSEIDEEENLEEDEETLEETVGPGPGNDFSAGDKDEYFGDLKPTENPLFNSLKTESKLKKICMDVINESERALKGRPSFSQLKTTLKKIEEAKSIIISSGNKINENLINSYVNILEKCFDKLTGRKQLNEVDIVLKNIDDKILKSGSDVIYEIDFSDYSDVLNYDDDDDLRSYRRKRKLENFDDDYSDEYDSDDFSDDFNDNEEIEITFDKPMKNENFGRNIMRRRNLRESVHERIMKELEEEMQNESLYEDGEMEEEEVLEMNEEELEEALMELDEEEENESRHYEGSYHEGELEEENLDEDLLEFSLNEADEGDDEGDDEDLDLTDDENESSSDSVGDLLETLPEMDEEELEEKKPELMKLRDLLDNMLSDEEEEEEEEEEVVEEEEAPKQQEKKALEESFNRYKKLYMESKSGSKQEAQYLNILKNIATRLSGNTLSESSRNRTSTSSNEQKLKNKLEESNLLNAKLLYTNKLLQNQNLTNRQKAKLVEKIDESRSLREVKLVFESVQRLTNESSRLTENRSRVIGSSSASTAGSSSSAGLMTESFEAQRWAKLAGIK